MADEEDIERMDGLAVNGERKTAREGHGLCIRTGKKSIPANRTYRTRTPASEPSPWDDVDRRGLACFSCCTAADLFSHGMHDALRARSSRLVTD